MNPFQKLVLLLASLAAGDPADPTQSRAERLRENRRIRHEQSSLAAPHPPRERQTAARRALRRV